MTTDNTTILLISVLVLNVITLLTVIVVATRSARSQPAPKPSKPNLGLSPVERQRLEAAAQEKIEAEVAQMTAALRKELESFTKDLKNVLLNNATTTLTSQLDQAKQLMAATVENLNVTLASAGNEAAAQLKTEVAQQKQKLVEQFEQHMAATISSYLVSALGMESAQSDQAAQALKQLESHKEEIRKDLLHEI